MKNEKNFRDLRMPIGALNKEKLEIFKEKYQDIKNAEIETPYFYGSHYSNPSNVLYFLIRSCPLLNYQFQGGMFGIPDRIFYSVSECWKANFSFGPEVQELIPE